MEATHNINNTANGNYGQTTKSGKVLIIGQEIKFWSQKSSWFREEEEWKRNDR